MKKMQVMVIKYGVEAIKKNTLYKTSYEKSSLN